MTDNLYDAMKAQLILVITVFIGAPLYGEHAEEVLIGKSYGVISYYGRAQQYAHSDKKHESGSVQLTSDVKTGSDSFQLLYHEKDIVSLKFDHLAQLKTKIKFRTESPTRILSDAKITSNGDILLSIVDIDKGFHVYRFNQNDKSYKLAMVASFFFVKGTSSEDKIPASSVGFDDSDNFIVRFDETKADTYEFKKNDRVVYKNKVKYEPSLVTWIQDSVPDKYLAE